MINPAKYYNPKLIPFLGEFCVFLLKYREVCLYECCDFSYLVALDMRSQCPEVVRMEIIFFHFTPG